MSRVNLSVDAVHLAYNSLVARLVSLALNRLYQPRNRAGSLEPQNLAPEGRLCAYGWHEQPLPDVAMMQSHRYRMLGRFGEIVV